MITSNFTIEEVTFNGHPDDGYDIPEISGYGDAIRILIQWHHCEDKEGSVTVKLGDHLLLPSQLEFILEQVTNYKLAIKHDV